jgi:hypothetical protein
MNFCHASSCSIRVSTISTFCRRITASFAADNAQAAVDAGAQIIVAHELTQCGNDQGQLVPLIEAIENNLGHKPEQASADSGYCSEANLEALEAHGIDGYVAPGRAKPPTAANGKIGGPLTQRMRKKIDDGGFEPPSRLRKQVVEPVFGQIKQARGFRQFLLRGVEKVRAEWAIICTTHNLLKLFTFAKGRISRLLCNKFSSRSPIWTGS